VIFCLNLGFDVTTAEYNVSTEISCLVSLNFYYEYELDLKLVG